MSYFERQNDPVLLALKDSAASKKAWLTRRRGASKTKPKFKPGTQVRIRGAGSRRAVAGDWEVVRVDNKGMATLRSWDGRPARIHVSNLRPAP